MSTRIELWVYRRLMPDLAEMGVQGARILCAVAFKTEDDYTETEWAIIDTGSPLSIIPQWVWKQCPVIIRKDHDIRGLVPKEECVLRASFGEITCCLLDEHNVTDDLTIEVDFVYSDELPIILGLRDLLERGVVYLDCQNDQAYLEMS